MPEFALHSEMARLTETLFRAPYLLATSRGAFGRRPPRSPRPEGHPRGDRLDRPGALAPRRADLVWLVSDDRVEVAAVGRFKKSPLNRLPDGRGRHPTANVPGDFAAHRGTAAAAATSASIETFDSHAFKSYRREECVRMPEKIARSDPRTPLGRSEMPGAIHPSHLGFQPVQKTPTIHVSLGFIWGIVVQRRCTPARKRRRCANRVDCAMETE